jgi:thiol-disulfide isomerase/thioredoxin
MFKDEHLLARYPFVLARTGCLGQPSSMKNGFVVLRFCIAALSLYAAAAYGGDDVKLDWQASDISASVGYYRPLRVELSAVKPDGIKTPPADLSAPLFGKMQLGPVEAPANYYIILDEPDGKPSRLFVDANANGDFTDDPAPEWKPRTDKTPDGLELTMYQGGAELDVSYGAEKLKAHLSMYRFDKHDPRRAALTNSLFCYRDYGRKGDISLSGKTYHALLLDDSATGDFRPPKDAAKSSVVLMLDLNNDGQFQMRGESFDVTKPFNIGGTTYEITNMTAAGVFQIVKSSQTVEETKPRPALAAGAKALPFDATTTDNDQIHFPDKYKGKVVLVDFWATWCPPCRAEVPHLAAAYEKYHDKGLEILGVSLDQANAADKLAQFTKENNMPWPEIYDGKHWSSAVAQLYFIDSIPHPFLIDGNTGVIVAEGDALRGDSLTSSIEKALAKRL